MFKHLFHHQRIGFVIALLTVKSLFACEHAFAQDGPAQPSGDAAIIPSGAKLETLWNAGDFTEGVAVDALGTIYFSDIPFNKMPGRVMKFDPRSGKVTVHCADSGKSNGLMFDRKGRLIAACGAMWGRQALVAISSTGQVSVLVDRYQGKRFNAPNDLVIHPNGSIYFSDPRYAGDEAMEIKQMSVYRYTRSGIVTRVMRVTHDIEKPNGLALSPDGKTLYVAETNNGTTEVRRKDPNVKTGRMTLNAFPIRIDGSLGRKRVLVNFGKETGIDGMTVDSNGNIYAAVRSAKRFGIVVFSPLGKERAYIPTPELPTNCCFGKGKGGQTLYITAGKGLFRITLKTHGFHPATSK
ncbi:MAG: SMP-30/gluconolactonase/LRE family protein [Planctomycetes bacterium]|nr:SMP-30/gluconolactonase/LRE family protein [Planctomycetota bacterium]